MEIVQKQQQHNEEDERREWAGKCDSKLFWDLQLTAYGKEGMIFPKSFQKWTTFIQDMGVRPDDTWVVTFPKCGTTWAQEMIWLLGNDLNFEAATENFLERRFPFLEFDSFKKVNPPWKTEAMAATTSMEFVDTMPSPRFIKSHLPLSLLPKNLLEKGAKVIYVARNPKDVFISYYHFSVLAFGYEGSLEEFLRASIVDATIYSPFWPNVKGFHDLHLQNHPNLLFLTYEEMKRDLKSVVLKTAKFMGKKAEAAIHLDENLDKLLNHLSFESMRKNPSVNKACISSPSKYTIDVNNNPLPSPPLPAGAKIDTDAENKKKAAFMRKGEVGSWKKELSPDWKAKLDQWMTNNEIVGLTF